MAGNEDKKDGNFTKKERWMIGVFIITAITSTLLFVITLVMIYQLKAPVTDTQTKGESAASSTTAGWEEKYNKLLNRTNENEIRTRELIAELQLQLTTKQNKTETSINKSEKLLEMALKGWFQANNGLLYKRPRFKKDFASAWSDCKEQGARLASTGIRSEDVRNDLLWNVIPTNEYTWIGLNKSHSNDVRTWSDEKPYETDDIPTNSLYSDCGLMLWQRSTIIGDDDACTSMYSFICEYNITQ